MPRPRGCKPNGGNQGSEGSPVNGNFLQDSVGGQSNRKCASSQDRCDEKSFADKAAMMGSASRREMGGPTLITLRNSSTASEYPIAFRTGLNASVHAHAMVNHARLAQTKSCYG